MTSDTLKPHSAELLKRRIKDGSEHYCLVPFTFLSISGKRLVPCPWLRNQDNYNTVSLQNLSQFKDLKEIWHSSQFYKVRNEIKEGSYLSCDLERCPQYMGKQWWMRNLNEIETDYPEIHSFLLNQEQCEHYPEEISLGYDSQCNLSCPSCDRDLQPQAQREQKKIILESLKKLGPHAKRITLAGMGDPFGTPHYYELLQGFPLEDFPKLEHIVLQTNGLKLNPKSWQALPEKIRERCNIMTLSIDGASPETYEKNRYPGKWTELLDTLNFLKELQEQKALKELHYTYVVQANNFLEMTAFVELVEMTKPHTVFFTRLSNWRDEELTGFSSKDIQDKKHPQHQDYLREKAKIEELKAIKDFNIVLME